MGEGLAASGPLHSLFSAYNSPRPPPPHRIASCLTRPHIFQLLQRGIPGPPFLMSSKLPSFLNLFLEKYATPVSKISGFTSSRALFASESILVSCFRTTFLSGRMATGSLFGAQHRARAPSGNEGRESGAFREQTRDHVRESPEVYLTTITIVHVRQFFTKAHFSRQEKRGWPPRAFSMGSPSDFSNTPACSAPGTPVCGPKHSRSPPLPAGTQDQSHSGSRC